MSNHSIGGDVDPRVHRLEGDVVRIGRAADNDVVLDDLVVAHHHARLRRLRKTWVLTDLDSTEGTYINGAAITHATVGPADLIAIGHQHLRLHDNQLELYVHSADVWLIASGLIAEAPNGAKLLSDINLALPPHTLTAIIGSAGVGKTTLLNALSGRRPADTGYVGYGNRDLYQNYAELRRRIVHLPSCHILPGELTVGRTLEFAAELRLAEASPSERKQRVAEVADQIGATVYLPIPLWKRKEYRRVMFSIGAELMTRPSLLFLDEPVSGLDPGMSRRLAEELRLLSGSVCSVVMTTSWLGPEVLKCFDRVLILAPGGRMAYFGPPEHMLSSFKCDNAADVAALVGTDGEDAAVRFAGSALYDTYVSLPTSVITPEPAIVGPSVRGTPQPPRVRRRRLAQFGMLCRRNAGVLVHAHLLSLSMRVLLASLLVWVSVPVIGGAGLSVSRAADTNAPRYLLLVLIIGGVLLGLTAPLRHAYREHTIYRHERGLGLSRGAYLAAKLAVFAPVTALQGLVLGLLGAALVPGPDEAVLIHPARLEIAVAVAAVAVASMVIGVGIATQFDPGDLRWPLVTVVALAQLLLSGGLFAVDDLPALNWLSWLSPSRWAYAMGACTINLQPLHTAGAADPLWRHDLNHWLGAWGGCAAAALAMLVALLVFSGRGDTERLFRRWRR